MAAFLAAFFLLAVFLVIPRLPHGFDFMPEHYEPPWYTRTTTTVFLVLNILFCPATLLFGIFGGAFENDFMFTPRYYFSLLLYTFVLAGLASFTQSRETNGKPKAAPGPASDKRRS